MGKDTIRACRSRLPPAGARPEPHRAGHVGVAQAAIRLQRHLGPGAHLQTAFDLVPVRGVQLRGEPAGLPGGPDGLPQG